jgi:hypothetical protein
LTRPLRAFQLLFLLPTGALFLVTGGDDLPVLGLMLLSLVLRSDSRPSLSALAISCAALMKATAWPLFLVLLVSRSRPTHGTSRAKSIWSSDKWTYLLVPTVLLSTVAWDGTGLVTDTVLFPLGRVGQVPRPESVLLTVVDAAGRAGHHLMLTLVVGVLVCVVLVAAAMLARPWLAGSPAAVAACITAGALLTMGPTARPGLWIYPLNLLLWGLLGAGLPRQPLTDRTDGPPARPAGPESRWPEPPGRAGRTDQATAMQPDPGLHVSCGPRG